MRVLIRDRRGHRHERRPCGDGSRDRSHGPRAACSIWIEARLDSPSQPPRDHPATPGSWASDFQKQEDKILSLQPWFVGVHFGCPRDTQTPGKPCPPPRQVPLVPLGQGWSLAPPSSWGCSREVREGTSRGVHQRQSGLICGAGRQAEVRN